jgi:hypothetical protein
MATFKIFVSLFVLFSISTNWIYANPNAIHCVVNDDPSLDNTERIGVNLTYWDTWGANQYMDNILMNPGFEGQVDRIVVIVTQSDSTSFSDGSGLGQADNYWVGASYEVRSGVSVGATGTIIQSLNQGANNLPQYFTNGPTPTLNVNDVVILTLKSNPNAIGQWWLSSQGVSTDNSFPAPGTPGPYYIVLQPVDANTPAEAFFYLDTINDRAGNLLNVTGPWQLSFWVRGEGPNPVLLSEFRRLSASTPFVVNSTAVSPTWQQVVINFTPTDTTAPGVLKLNLSNLNYGTTIYIDNVFLGPIQSENPTTAWRTDVINMLKAMQPSYLRDWQGQLADDFPNRIMTQMGRISWNERLYGGSGSLSFGYSIPDLFDLCDQVGSKPWVIIPTTLTDAELDAFGAFLAQNATTTRYPEIILEFGNENWNWIFRSLGIPIPAACGPVSDRAFTRITAAAGSGVNIRRVINGQFYNPYVALAYANASTQYDTLAVAPYFLLTLDQSATESGILTALFQDNNPLYKQINDGLDTLDKNLAVYEVNMETLDGTASVDTRNTYVTAAVGGSALAKRLIDGMLNKASPQLVFALAGFDTNAYIVPGFVKLWGIVRDVSPTKLIRPTGLAVTMLNQVTAGSVHKVVPTAYLSETTGEALPLPTEAKNLTLAAFRTVQNWGAAAVNANPTAQTIRIEFPNDTRAVPSLANVLTYNSFLDNNENSEMVTIATSTLESPFNRTIKYTIPPYGFVVFSSALGN